MKRKLFSAILFGALLTASTSGLTSCKDYDDDISNLQSQIDKLATADQLSAKVSELQAAIAAAQSAAESKAAAAETVAKAAQAAADAAATAASKAQSSADGASQAAKDAAAAAAAANEVGKAAQAAVEKLAAEAATKAELEAAKDAAAAAVKAIQDAHATDKAAIEKAIADSKEELLAKINANTKALADLDTRLTAVEAQLKAIIDGEGGETSLDVIAAEVEAIGEAVEELLGAFTMATCVDLYNGEPGFDNKLNFWKVKEAVTAEFPREADADLVDGGAYSFEKKTERVYEDSILVRVNPVDAVLDAENIVLVNSQGAEISSDLVTVTSAQPYKRSVPLMTRAAGDGNGLWVVKFKANDDLKSDKDLQKEFKNATTFGPKSILFALGVDEPENAGRRLVSKYDLTLACDDAVHATTFEVNGTSVKNIKNRFQTSEEGVQVPKAVYGIDYSWRAEDDNFTLTSDAIVTKAEDKKDYTVVDDNRNGKKILMAEVGQVLNISFPETTPIKGFYVTIDWKRAVESAASEITAWNKYEYENVAKVSKNGTILEAAPLQEGNNGYIVVNDLKDYSNVGDVIGFRVFAVNLDGTLVDPDGQAFYVGFGQSSEVEVKTVALEDQTIEVKFAAGDDKKNEAAKVDVTEAFSGVEFDQIQWSVAKAGEDGVVPVYGDFKVRYVMNDENETVKDYADFGKNGIFFEDVKAINIQIIKPTHFVDNGTYQLVGDLRVKVGNDGYSVRKVTVNVKKKMPTSMPSDYELGFEAYQTADQVLAPQWATGSSRTSIGFSDIKNGAYGANGKWVGYDNRDSATNWTKNLFNLKDVGEGTIDLNAIYRFKNGKYVKDVNKVGYIIEGAAADGADSDTAADNVNITAGTHTANIAGNFINGGQYAVKSTYTYENISRRKQADNTWSQYAEADLDLTGLSGTDLTDAKAFNAKNDYVAKVALPSLNLIPWSKQGTEYVTYAWWKKCVKAQEKNSAGVVTKAAEYIDNNEVKIADSKNTIAQEIHLGNVLVFLGNKVKNFSLLRNADNADALANTAKVVTFGKTNDETKFNSTHNTAKINAWTVADGKVNPFFMVEMKDDSTIQLVQLKDKAQVPAHKCKLYVEVIDMLGHSEIVELELSVVEEYADVVLPDGSARAEKWDGLANSTFPQGSLKR